MEWKQQGNSKYGLQLRAPSVAKKALKPLPHPVFGGNEEDDVEEQIARQATKKKALKDVEQQHKRALEEDLNVFDYDAVYDEIKEQKTRHIHEDQCKREPKYIQKLVEKAKLRAQEHDIVYERQLAKERSKEDHLYGDKEKFVTSAYKKKLAEQAKWLEEERLRDLREVADEVTKKSDMSDFYRNLLSKNVAFGAPKVNSQKLPIVQKEESKFQDLKADEKSSATFSKIAESGSTLVEEESMNRPLDSTVRSESHLHPEKLAPCNITVSDESLPPVNKTVQGDISNVSKTTRGDALCDLQHAPSVEAVPSIYRERVESEPQFGANSTTFIEAKTTIGSRTQTDSILAAKERYLARKRLREA